MTERTLSRTTFTLASTLESVGRIEDTALQFAGRAGFDSGAASHIGLVAREAAVNAVLHGNHGDLSKHVQATFELTAEELRIVIADEGAGLDPATLPDPLAPENLLRSSGRGVFLMRALMDRVDFRSLHPGTEITLTKRRADRS